MLFSQEVVEALQQGELAVIPTDTLYGIVCSARNKEAVEKLYRIRGRHETKPCIILISDISDLEEFGITLNEIDKDALNKVWPGKVSVVFDCPSDEWAHLHRGGTKTLAFRVPDDEELRNLLRNTGPLPAPSANPEGQPPAHTITEAKKYFLATPKSNAGGLATPKSNAGGSDQVAIYVDGGYKESLPSTVARLHDGVWEVLRQGVVELK